MYEYTQYPWKDSQENQLKIYESWQGTKSHERTNNALQNYSDQFGCWYKKKENMLQKNKHQKLTPTKKVQMKWAKSLWQQSIMI